MKTLYDKVWESHKVATDQEGDVIFIDKHLIHEVTSPQAFSTLEKRGLKILFPERIIATTDHNVPTKYSEITVKNPAARAQIERLKKNCNENGITIYDLNSPYQGIVHVIAPELGYIHPGLTVVCGDSHTSTHGAFGALAFGIGTSEIEKVLASQSITQIKSKNMLVNIEGSVPKNITAKDIVLYAIKVIGVNGGSGYVIEYKGDVISDMSVEGRMTLCNMSIEAGAKAGLIAPDEKVFDYLYDLPHSPKGELWNKAINYWNTLYSDIDASFDKVINISVNDLSPQVTWGTNPSQVISIHDCVPLPDLSASEEEVTSHKSALQYMGLKGGENIKDIKVDVVFIGSCTNSRIEDLRLAAKMIGNRHCHKSVTAIVVPGSKLVAKQAIDEGLKKIFEDAGFDWRKPGCSMCVGINGDSLQPMVRCASTSNRNFEGRQGKNSRTHLVSPSVAAATAIAGHFSEV